MAEILSQSQIDMLLSSLTGGGAGAAGAGDADAAGGDAAPGGLAKDAASQKKVKEYDFRSPKLFTREQLKLLYSIYENYARIVSSFITGMLQTYCLVEIVEVEEQQYYEFNNALPDSVLVGLLDFDVKDDDMDENLVLMEMSKDIGFTAIDRFLGGVGIPIEDDREYTEIEITLIEHLFKGMIGLMKNVWADHLEIAPRLMKIETNSRILQGISADENVVIVVMSILVNETQGKLTLCIPAVTLDTMFKKKALMSKRNQRKGDALTEAQRRAGIINEINKTDLEVTAVLGHTTVMSEELVKLEIGDVILLNKPENSLVDLLVEGSLWFRGELGLHNKKKAVAIRELHKKGSESTL